MARKHPKLNKDTAYHEMWLSCRGILPFMAIAKCCMLSVETDLSTCQIWFRGGSPNLSMIYKWRQRSFLDNNFHNLPLNCCTWFLIWWEFLNCPFLATLTSRCRFFVKGPQTTFAWCHLLSLEKGHACISKHDQSPKMHPILPRSAFCSGGHRFLGRFWDATCA